jgi:SPP1 family predicted phage head-tail adaptor
MTLVSSDPGLRDREITLQTATITQDPDTGEELIDWTANQLTLYAQWLPGSTREAYFAQQRLGTLIDGVFRVEYIDRPVPETQRVLFEGMLYDIKPPVEVGRHDGWLIPVVGRGDRP